MREYRVELKGINRLVGSADNDVGFCSELINLSEQSGMKVIGEREVVSANLPYKWIKMHRIGKVINYIGVQDDATGVKVVHFNPETGEVIDQIATFAVGSDINYVFLNNQLVISDRTGIKEYVYIFKGTYELLYSGLEFDIHPSVDSQFPIVSNSYESILAQTEEEYLAGCRSVINKFEINNKHYCEGIFLYAFSLTLYDGTETGMYGLNAVVTDRVYNSTGDADLTRFIELTGIEDKKYIQSTFNWSYFYQQHSLVISPNANMFSKHKDFIQKVNLYVSAPISRMPVTEENTTITGVRWENGEALGTGDILWMYFNTKLIKDLGAEKALLYKQKSWHFEEFCNGVGYLFEFGGDVQTTGATMEVYASDLDRAGKMYTYNNRVHFYDSVVRLKGTGLGNIKVKNSEATTSTADVYVYLHTGLTDSVLKFEDVPVSIGTLPTIYLPYMLTFADSRAYRMQIVCGGYSIDYTLSSSPAYNYAYAYPGDFTDGKPVTMTSFDGVTPTLSNTYDETNVVNVTAAGAPTVFPVAYSYKFDGNITGLSVAMESISESQVGQYPLNVFTDNGIYALQQGTGAVLYANIVPISGDICENASIIYTRQGIAYISNGAVYLLAGRKAQKLSLLLDGEPDIYIQDNDSFTRCCGNTMYDITPYLSNVRFRDYVENATLSWCPDTNELIVSNSNYSYSYVYDFVFNSWHKETGTFEGVGGNFILRPVQMHSNNATPATAKVTLSAIHAETARSFTSVCQATYDTTLSCGAGHTLALIINGTQVASASFGQTTKMNMIVSTLCEDIGYLEDYNGKIYSSIDLSGQVVKVFNITTGTQVWGASFSAASQTVDIPNKAIGATISVTIGNSTYSTEYTASDSVITAISKLTEKINTSDNNVSAQMMRNSIILTARTPGSAANSIAVSANASDEDYIYIKTSSSTLTGGSNISLLPSEYKHIIDWSRQSDTAQQIVHLHTRPLHLGDNNTYKTIRRSVLNCLAQLTGSLNLSMYIFASDNLTKWKCVCAAQRKDCNIAQITTHRAAKAYKYFVFMIGGVVQMKTQLSDIILTLEDITTKKLR